MPSALSASRYGQRAYPGEGVSFALALCAAYSGPLGLSPPANSGSAWGIFWAPPRASIGLSPARSVTLLGGRPSYGPRFRAIYQERSLLHRLWDREPGNRERRSVRQGDCHSRQDAVYPLLGTEVRAGTQFQKARLRPQPLAPSPFQATISSVKNQARTSVSRQRGSVPSWR